MQNEPAPGPIDVVVIEFPDGADASGVANELSRLLDVGTIRLFDIVAVRKGLDGDIGRLQLAGSGTAIDAFARFAGARSDLFDDTDVDEAGAILDPGTAALMIAYENTWAGPFVGAAHAAGGQMVASERIPAQVLLDALDAAESEI